MRLFLLSLFTMPIFVCISFSYQNGSYQINAQIIGDCNTVKAIQVNFEEPFEGPTPLEANPVLQKDSVSCGRSYFSALLSFDEGDSPFGEEYMFTLDLVDTVAGSDVVIGQQIEYTITIDTTTTICQMTQL